MAIYNTAKSRAERRAQDIKKITANKKNAEVFLKKAGIVNRAGTLSKVYK